MKCYLKTDIDGIYEYRLFTEKGLIKWVNTEIQQNDSNETSVITDLNEVISFATEMLGFGKSKVIGIKNAKIS